MIGGLKKRGLAILLIMGAAFAVYARSLWNGYVWDDSALIQRDPFIRSWRLLAEGFRHFLFAGATASDFYRPIQRVTYTWDYAWAGFRPALYHFDNILIHGLAGVFLLLLVERLLRLLGRGHALKWGVAIAGLWVIHPLWTSAVCYVSGRADPLEAMFGFCGLWLALRGTRTGAAVAGLMFLCAILSKESGVVFLPICMALVVMTGHGREEIARWVVIGLLVAGAALCLRLTAEHTTPPAGRAIEWGARPIVALRALAEYAGLFVAPVRLHMERDVLPFGRGDAAATLRMARDREFQTLLGAMLLGGLVWWMAWARRRDAGVLAGLVCFGIAYLPVCGLFSLNASVAEHWLYVPGAFLLMAALLSASWLHLTREVGIAALAVWACFLGARTILRNGDWHDDRTFVEQTIRDGGGSARMLINLGGLDLADGNTQGAIGDYQKALELAPDQPFGLIGLGSAYLRAKEFDQARGEFVKALDYPITGATALQDLAVVEYVETRKDRLDLLEKAAAIAPEDWDIQKRYIMHLGELGQLGKEIITLRAITAEEPWQADAWRMLGDAWAHVRQYDSAARAYGKAIALDVHDEETPRKLAAVERMGR